MQDLGSRVSGLKIEDFLRNVRMTSTVPASLLKLDYVALRGFWALGWTLRGLGFRV